MFAHFWSCERKQVPLRRWRYFIAATASSSRLSRWPLTTQSLTFDDSVADLSTLFTLSTASITDVRGRRSCLRLKVFVRPQSESRLHVPASPSSAALLLCSSLISSCLLLLLLCPSRQLLQELWQLAGRGGLWRQQSQLLRAQRLVGTGATRCLTRPLLRCFVFFFVSRIAAMVQFVWMIHFVSDERICFRGELSLDVSGILSRELLERRASVGVFHHF